MNINIGVKPRLEDILLEIQSRNMKRASVEPDKYIENQITIIYDTLLNGTMMMAEYISKGIREVDKDIKIKVFKVSSSNKSDIIFEIYKSKAILVGSHASMMVYINSLAGLLDVTVRLGMKNRLAGVFGSYGIEGESQAKIIEMLKLGGFNVIGGNEKVLWNPDNISIGMCIEFGKKFAEMIN